MKADKKFLLFYRLRDVWRGSLRHGGRQRVGLVLRAGVERGGGGRGAHSAADAAAAFGRGLARRHGQLLQEEGGCQMGVTEPMARS